MKIIVADTGALISLGIVKQINLIENVFGEFYIANAVWEELRTYDNPQFDKNLLFELENRVVKIKSMNHLSVLMDYVESESMILYKEINADFLLIDDHKARTIAESLSINCIGSIGLLIKAKQKGLVKDLRPIFKKWIENKRYFSKKLMNKILIQIGEDALSY